MVLRLSGLGFPRFRAQVLGFRGLQGVWAKMCQATSAFNGITFEFTV